MWTPNYVLFAVHWHAVVTCTWHACSNTALSAGTEHKKLWYTHTHTQMPLTQAGAVFWSHGPPDWLRTLDEAHATNPASPAYLRMIGRYHNTWHSDTDLALVLQCRKRGICVWLHKKQKQVTVSHFTCNRPGMFYWKIWSVWIVLILQFRKGYSGWILSALFHLFLNKTYILIMTRRSVQLLVSSKFVIPTSHTLCPRYRSLTLHVRYYQTGHFLLT